MSLTWPVMLAVLFGALLHASWNALVKSSADKSLDTALIHLFCSLAAIPLIAVYGWPPAVAWPYILASVTIHLAYYITLTGAYDHGDLNLTYPIMRGTAPLIVALSASVVLGEVLTPGAWIGIVGISAGVLLLGFSRNMTQSCRAIAFALCNAVIIAAYTIVDSKGVRATGDAIQYIAALTFLDGWPFAALVLYRKRKLDPTKNFQVILDYARKRWPLALLGACASIGSYSIALWAMTKAPVATIAALRETSVLFAVLMSAIWLKEAFTLSRVMSALLIVAGAFALRLGA
jgi:phosphonate utilization associated putative membrane protein